MKRNALIGLSGPKHSGKTEVGKVLENHNIKLMMFATPIKKALAAILDCPVACFEDQTFKEGIVDGLNVTRRAMLQTLGTEWGREMIHPDIWVYFTKKEIERDFWPWIALTDIRFENEAEMIRSMGGTVVHIERPGYAWDAKTHDSEAGVEKKPEDRTLPNVAGLSDLERTVRDVLGDFLVP